MIEKGKESEKELRERLGAFISRIGPLSVNAMELSGLKWSRIAKPLHSLGLLEEAVIRLAGIYGSSQVDIGKRALVIFCADNGIVKEGVSQTGQEVTAVVTEQMTRGKSCACLMAKRAGVQVFPVDIGVAGKLHPGNRFPLIRRKLAYGTKSFKDEPAMTCEMALKAIFTGIGLVEELKEKGFRLIAAGEMGIGNTTTSSAVASMLLNRPPSEITGRGAGLSDEGLNRKVKLIEEARKRYGDGCRDAVDVMARVGGLDLAGLTGVFLGGAIYRLPVLIDGFITAAAALTAARLSPLSAAFMLATHVSAEPGCRLLTDELGLKPFVTAGLCLGEGTGAVAAIPLIDMALEVYHRMSTFRQIALEEYKPLGGEGC